jgi:tryptophan halogenase
VLYGMNYPTDLSGRASRYIDGARAQAVMQKIQQHATAASNQLLPHRELIERIKRYGLQKY